MKAKIDTKGLDKLKNRLAYIGQESIDELEEEVANLAMTLYSRAQALAEEKLHSGVAEYIDALSISESREGGLTTYTIKLDPSANKWEEGFPSYDMKEGLLAGPNSSLGVNGARYNTVPFEHTPYNKGPAGPTVTALKQSAQKAIAMYGLNEIIKTSGNKVLQGKVGVINDKRFNANIQGMTKYQSGQGKKAKSTFMTFRRVSDNSDPDSWIHPGFEGIHLFEELSSMAEEEMDNIIKRFLR